MRVSRSIASYYSWLNSRDEPDIVVAVDVGSARVGCVIAELGPDRPTVLAAESAASYGIRAGEVINLKRAGEAISIAIEAAADRAETDVKTVVVGFSGDVKISSAKAALELDRERRMVLASDLARLKSGVVPEVGAGRRIIHRFDGPYSVGDLQGVDYPEGLIGDRLEMQAAFLSADGDRLDNLLRAVRSAEVEIEAVALEPMACSLGALVEDERALGAAVLDLGAGAFRGALWEGGRLKQIHTVGREIPGVQSGSGRYAVGAALGINGMEAVVLALSRRFRIATVTAERLLRSHGALSEDVLATLPPTVEVAAVDGLSSVRIETKELSQTLEELLVPAIRSLREGLFGGSAGHVVSIVLTGGGARIKGLPTWISKRFGNAPVRLGAPGWKVNESASMPPELLDCCGCSLAGLIALAAEGRARLRYHGGASLIRSVGNGLRKFVASL
ncbi:MAG: cell division FtsA domain-containing protein [Planctomycetota bacterium]